MTLEVDGTLHNPIVLRSFVVCAIPVVIVAILTGHDLASSATRGKRRGMALVLLIFVSPILIRIVGNALYQVGSRGIISVGFWGGPPIWAMPAIAVLFTAIGYAMTRLTRRYTTN